jgi:hypothetical protein
MDGKPRLALDDGTLDPEPTTGPIRITRRRVVRALAVTGAA